MWKRKLKEIEHHFIFLFLGALNIKIKVATGHGFGWTLGVGDGQEGLACCGSWGCKELDMTE